MRLNRTLPECPCRRCVKARESAARDYARMLLLVRGSRVWNARGRTLIGADVTGSFQRTVGLARAGPTG